MHLTQKNSLPTTPIAIQQWVSLGAPRDGWFMVSLKLEGRFQHALEPPPCPRREMKARSIDENDLARALAKAAAMPVSDIDHVLIPTALRLLGEGSRQGR